MVWSYTLPDINLDNYYPQPKYLIIEPFGPLESSFEFKQEIMGQRTARRLRLRGFGWKGPGFRV